MNRELITITRDLIVSSDPSLGAKNIQDNGSRFEVEYNPALTIPREAINPVITVERAEIFYTFPNISASLGNNKFYVSKGVTDYVLTIPDGLYSLDQLEQTILTLGENAGITNSPDTFIELNPDEATQKVLLVINYTDVKVEFKSDSPLEILGFNDGTSFGPPVSAPTTYFAPNTAGFNSVNSIQIHTDLVNDGIGVNNKYTQIAGVVQITATPGSQIIYEPLRPQEIGAENLVATKRTRVVVYITDENGDALDTFSEFYQVTFRLTYQVAKEF